MVAHDGRGVEFGDGGRIEGWRGGIGSAAFGQGEEPLDVVVDGFEAAVVPAENLGEGAVAVVGHAVAVEGDEGMR